VAGADGCAGAVVPPVGTSPGLAPYDDGSGAVGSLSGTANGADRVRWMVEVSSSTGDEIDGMATGEPVDVPGRPRESEGSAPRAEMSCSAWCMNPRLDTSCSTWPSKRRRSARAIVSIGR
jgi:hypothetical protein